MKEITKAQEEILKALWQVNNGAVSDVLDVLPDPKPAYNTVATVIKVLSKGVCCSQNVWKNKCVLSCHF